MPLINLNSKQKEQYKFIVENYKRIFGIKNEDDMSRLKFENKVYLWLFEETKPVNPPEHLDSDYHSFLSRLGKGEELGELESYIREIIGEIYTYQKNPEFGKAVDDAIFILFEIFKDWIINVLSKADPKTALTKIDQWIDMMRLVEGEQLFDIEYLREKFSDALSFLYDAKRQPLPNTFFKIIRCLNNAKKFCHSKLANMTAKEEFDGLISKSKVTLNSGVRFLHFALNNKEGSENCSISNLKDFDKDGYLKDYVNTRAGFYLKHLAVLPCVEIVNSDDKMFDNYLKCLNIFLIDANPLAVSKQIEQEFLDPKMESGLDKEIISQQVKVLQPYLKLHGLLQKLAESAVILKLGSSIAGEAGNIFVYDTIKDHIKKLMINIIDITEDININLKEIEVICTGHYENLLANRVRKQANPWMRNYGVALQGAEILKTDLKECRSKALSILGKACEGISQKRQERIKNTVKMFIKMVTDVSGSTDLKEDNYPLPSLSPSSQLVPDIEHANKPLCVRTPVNEIRDQRLPSLSSKVEPEIVTSSVAAPATVDKGADTSPADKKEVNLNSQQSSSSPQREQGLAGKVANTILSLFPREKPDVTHGSETAENIPSEPIVKEDYLASLKVVLSSQTPISGVEEFIKRLQNMAIAFPADEVEYQAFEEIFKPQQQPNWQFHCHLLIQAFGKSELKRAYNRNWLKTLCLIGDPFNVSQYCDKIEKGNSSLKELKDFYGSDEDFLIGVIGCYLEDNVKQLNNFDLRRNEKAHQIIEKYLNIFKAGKNKNFLELNDKLNLVIKLHGSLIQEKSTFLASLQGLCKHIENGNYEKAYEQLNKPFLELCFSEKEEKIFLLIEAIEEKTKELPLKPLKDFISKYINEQTALGKDQLSSNMRAILSQKLVEIAARNSLLLVALLLQWGATWQIGNKGRSSILHNAVANGHLDCLEVFIQRGASVNYLNYNGSSLLHSAVEGGHLHLVKWLIAQGSRLDHADSNGCTPLHVAVYQGCTAIAHELLNYPIEIDAKTKEQDTALHIAVKQNDREMVAALLKNGADINILDNNQQMPLELAKNLKRVEICELLDYHRHSSNEYILLKKHLQTQQLALSKLTFLEKPFNSAIKVINTLQLERDCLIAEYQLLEKQLSYLENLIMEQPNGVELQTWQKAYHQATNEIIQNLCKKYAEQLTPPIVVFSVKNPEFHLFLVENEGLREEELERFQKQCREIFLRSYLEWSIPAMMAEAKECFSILKQKEKDIYKKTTYDNLLELKQEHFHKLKEAIQQRWGVSHLPEEQQAKYQQFLDPFYSLFCQKDPNILKQLNAQKFLGNKTSYSRVLQKLPNALHLACQAGQLEIVKYLANDLGLSCTFLATKELRPNDGYYPMHFAAMHENPQTEKILDFLYQHTSEIDSLGKAKRTALEIAALSGNVTATKWLLAHGAKLASEKDSPLEDTPLYNGACSNSFEVIETLLQHGADPYSAFPGGKENAYTPLMKAIWEGHLEAAKAFWKNGIWLTKSNYDKLFSHFIKNKHLTDFQKKCLLLPGKKEVVILENYVLNYRATYANQLVMLYREAKSRWEELGHTLLNESSKRLGALEEEQIKTEWREAFIDLQLSCLQKYADETREPTVEQKSQWEKHYKTEVVVLLKNLQGDVENLINARGRIYQGGRLIDYQTHPELKASVKEAFLGSLRKEIDSYSSCQFPLDFERIRQIIKEKKVSRDTEIGKMEKCHQSKTLVNDFFQTKQEKYAKAIEEAERSKADCFESLRSNLNIPKASFKAEECATRIYGLLQQQDTKEETKQLEEINPDLAVHYIASTADRQQEWQEWGLLELGKWVADRDINAWGPDGRTLLSAAAFYGQITVVSFLLKNGAQVNRGDKTNELILSPDEPEGQVKRNTIHLYIVGDQELHYKVNLENKIKSYEIKIGKNPDNSITNEIFNQLKELKKRALDLNSAITIEDKVIEEHILNITSKRHHTCFSSTPLHNAASGGFAGIVELLLAAGADPRILNLKGETALVEAIRYGHLSVVQVFWRHGVWLSKQEKVAIELLSKEPLQGHLQKHLELVRSQCLMLPAIENQQVKMLYEQELPTLEGSEENSFDANSSKAEVKTHTTFKGRTVPPWISRLSNSSDLQAALEDLKQDITLYDAIYYQNKEQLEELMASGTFEQPNQDGITPLMYAAACGSIKMLRELRRLGANVADRDKWGNNALHIAAAFGRVSSVVWLIQEGGLPLEERGYKDTTPFLQAAVCGQLITLQELYKLNANPLAYDVEHNNALHLAAMFGHADIISWLFKECRLGMENRSREGYTPFLRAAASGKLAALQKLRNLGSDTRSTDNFENNALHLAVKGGYLNVVNWLIEISIPLNSVNKLSQTPLELAVTQNHRDLAAKLKFEQQEEEFKRLVQCCLHSEQVTRNFAAHQQRLSTSITQRLVDPTFSEYAKLNQKFFESLLRLQQFTSWPEPHSNIIKELKPFYLLAFTKDSEKPRMLDLMFRSSITLINEWEKQKANLENIYVILKENTSIPSSDLEEMIMLHNKGIRLISQVMSQDEVTDEEVRRAACEVILVSRLDGFCFFKKDISSDLKKFGPHHIMDIDLEGQNSSLRINPSVVPPTLGTSWMVNALDALLGAKRVVATEFLKLFASDGSSQTYQVQENAQTATLLDVLETYPNAIEKVNLTHFSRMIILGILTNLQDGFPNKFIVKINREASNSLKSIEILGIDSSLAFGEPFSLNQNRVVMNVRNILYFLPQMKKVIDPAFVDYFLQQVPELLLINWLKMLYQKNQEYKNLHIKGILSSQDPGILQPIKIASGVVEKLYNTLLRLREVLSSKEEITHHQLLSTLQLDIGALYSCSGNPLECMKGLDKARCYISKEELAKMKKFGRLQSIEESFIELLSVIDYNSFGKQTAKVFWQTLQSASSLLLDKKPLLHVAAKTKNLNLAAFLLPYQMQAVDAANQEGNTALHIAASCGDVKMIELLKKYGADANRVDRLGRGALDKARDREQHQAVVFLSGASGRQGEKPHTEKFKAQHEESRDKKFKK